MSEQPQIRPEVVSLLVNGQGSYADMLTPPPTRAESQAALDYLLRVQDFDQDMRAELDRAMDLMAPCLDRVIAASTPEELAAAVMSVPQEVRDEVAAIHERLDLYLSAD